MTKHTISAPGASVAAVRAHYDTGNDFFSLWLDERLVYSCALWDGDDDTLDAAQVRKLAFHADAANARGARRVLDIGCGWGAMLAYLVQEAGVGEAVGLTLSAEQAAWIAQHPIPHRTVRVEHWIDHTPAAPYDAIISIGAIEHFVRPSDSHASRVATYRAFFEKCASMLPPGGRLSLQTSVYANGSFVEGAVAAIFPESDLPRMDQLAEASDGVMTLVDHVSHGAHYDRTCAVWRRRMRDAREAVIAASSEETFGRYQPYLAAASKGFQVGVFDLVRLVYERPR